MMIFAMVNNFLKNLKLVSLTINSTEKVLSKDIVSNVLMLSIKELHFIALGIHSWDVIFVANKVAISILFLSKDFCHHITVLMRQDDLCTNQGIKILAIHMVVKVFIWW